MAELYASQFSNVPELVDLHIKLTGAADVDASGYTINHGDSLVSAVAKTAEGKAKITLKQAFYEVVSFSGACSLAGSFIHLENDTVNNSDPHIDIIFQNDAGTDADPDAGVIYLRVGLRRANVAVF